MLKKLGYLVGGIFSAGALLSSTGDYFGDINWTDQFGVLVALFQAGAYNMFDNFGAKQFQIVRLMKASGK